MNLIWSCKKCGVSGDVEEVLPAVGGLHEPSAPCHGMPRVAAQMTRGLAGIGAEERLRAVHSSGKLASRLGQKMKKK